MTQFRKALKNPLFQKKMFAWVMAILCIIMAFISAKVKVLQITIPIFMIGALLFSVVSFWFTVKIFLKIPPKETKNKEKKA